MKIESVDFFYLSIPQVRDIGDGSKDALRGRVQGGGFTGWGECEASPRVSIASWNCPMSHSACKPVSASVLGQRLDGVADIRRINALVREQSFDLLQADHTLSGIDIALWDLLGKKLGEPVWRLLGHPRAYAKTAYASQLFGDDPQVTLRRAQAVARAGFRAAKFGWGPYGTGTVEADADQVHAARRRIFASLRRRRDTADAARVDLHKAQSGIIDHRSGLVKIVATLPTRELHSSAAPGQLVIG